MRWVKTVLLLLAIFVVIIFSVQNQSEVMLRFAFPWEGYEWFIVPSVRLPLFLVILCSIFLGILIAGVGDLYQRFQIKKSLRKNQKKVDMLEREIQSLRSIGPGESSSFKREG
jgi:uncharacterized integral membrane protein